MKTDRVAAEVYRKLKCPVAFTDLYHEGDKDSLDYAGEYGTIVFVGTKTRGIRIVVAGETAFITPDGTKFKNRPAESEGHDKDKVEWDNNNWFELILVKDCEELDYEVGVEYDLDEAVKRAMEILEDPTYWEE